MTNAAKKKLAESLKRAIKGEIDGYAFYNGLIQMVTNDDARGRLEQLRDDEVRHKDVLYDLYDTIIGGRPETLPEKGINALSDLFKRGKLDTRKTELEFIDLAIEAELAAVKFYQSARDQFDDPQFHALFDQLADEEHSHYELLQAERAALSGSYHWFSIDTGSYQEH